jgi:transposase-like protein
MPWKEFLASEERVRFVLAARNWNESFAAMCGWFGISRKTGRKWWQRYRSGGIKAFAGRPLVGELSPWRLWGSAVAAAVSAANFAKLHCGAPKIGNPWPARERSSCPKFCNHSPIITGL